MSQLSISSLDLGKRIFDQAANDFEATPAERVKMQIRRLSAQIREIEGNTDNPVVERSDELESLHAQTSMLQARLFCLSVLNLS